jgi:predicted dehydrogenase
MDAKLGLVGCGKWGVNYLKFFSSLHGLIVYDSDLDKIERSLPTYVKIASNLNEVIDYSDGIIIATPPSSHSDIAKICLDAKKPVLVEKPVALNYDDVKSIFELADRKNISVLVNNIHLFSSPFLVLRKIVKTWKYPLLIRSIGGNHGPFRNYSPLLDYGPHDLSMCLSLFNNPPNSVSVSEDAEGIYTIKLKFDNSKAEIAIGNGMSKKYRYFEVLSHDGQSMSYDDLVPYDKLKRNGQSHSILVNNYLFDVIKTFIEYIETGAKDWRFNHRLNLEIMRILTMDINNQLGSYQIW